MIDVAEQSAEAERKPIAPPEAHGSADATAAAEGVATVEHVVNASNIVVLEQVREQAERQLAGYLAPKLIQQLRDRGQSEASINQLFADAQISFTGELTHGKTDVRISITGTHVGASEALMGDLLVQAMKEHPSFASFFASEHPPHAQPAKGKQAASIALHVPQLETAAYAQLMQAVAASETTAKAKTGDEKPSPILAEVESHVAPEKVKQVG